MQATWPQQEATASIPESTQEQQQRQALGPAPSLPTFSTRADLLAEAVAAEGPSTTNNGASVAVPSGQVLSSDPQLASIQAAKHEFSSALRHLKSSAGSSSAQDEHSNKVAELTSALDALVKHLERLQDVSILHNHARTPPAGLSTAAASGPMQPSEGTAAASPQDSDNTFQAISNTASTLKLSAREVVLAEQELLWSCVDDLLFQVAWLCRPQAVHQSNRQSIHSVSDYSIHDLPLYSTPAQAHSEHHPDAPPSYVHDDAKEEAGRDAPDHLVMTDEKAQLELHGITTAIERLYSVSPQLSNQRVAPPDMSRASSSQAKQEVREAQLMRLGRAIERLSKGRLEDQRATFSPSASFTPESFSSASSAKGKERQEEAELDRIMSAMDKASNASLANQRVALSDRQMLLLAHARQTAHDAAQAYGLSGDHTTAHRQPAAPLDRDELARREHILAHTGIGRIDSQDAPAPLLSDNPVRSFPESLSSDKQQQSAPLNKQPPPKRQSSSAALRKRFSMLRMGSQDSSRSVFCVCVSGRKLTEAAKAASVHPIHFHLRCLALEHRHIQQVKLRLWSLDSALPLDKINVALASSPSPIAHISLATSNEVVRSFRLPAPCISLDTVLLQRNVLTCTFKTAPSSSPSSSLQSQFPPPPPTETMSAAEFTTYPPVGLSCARCGCSILSLELSSSTPAPAQREYTPLPSEHWAELIEAWMCHAPETLTTDIVHRYGTDGFKPNHESQVLVGHHYLILQPPKIQPQGLTLVDNVSSILPLYSCSFSVLGRSVA